MARGRSGTVGYGIAVMWGGHLIAPFAGDGTMRVDFKYLTVLSKYVTKLPIGPEKRA